MILASCVLKFIEGTNNRLNFSTAWQLIWFDFNQVRQVSHEIRASCATLEMLGYLLNQNGGEKLSSLKPPKPVMSFLPAAPSVPLPPPLPVIKTANEQIQISENQESSKIKGLLEQCLRIIVEDSGNSTSRNWVLCNVNVQAKLQGNAPRWV